MKKVSSYVAAIVLSLVMVFSFSGCSITIMGEGGIIDIDAMVDFILHGWDGIYEEKESAEYVAPDPTVKHNEIRENHRVTTVNNKVTDSHRVTTVKHEVESTDTSTAVVEVAKTDTVD